MKRGHRDGDTGQATAFIAIVAVALIMVAGMAYDGGQFLRAYLEASDLAEAAARAGAESTGPADLFSGDISLDPAAAQANVAEFMAAAGHPGAATTTATAESVTVIVTLEQSAYILPIGSRSISATATAEPARGVTAADS
jgi:Flp pilus assembly protein TadG